ncbi:hypothetical protein A8F94_01155 [Bacillus sp. FJAT-27225]|uniref:ROK family transcriptional regulator n=1 Tax=Bacillus sp. FJAT-27225 TaxID=1743144 RepID=UPI00080C3002|nr:ROK family protein [Bacillus sp. FJAT-27225]OCA91503.1 hypothetical protein A8F94_01155 [Bacillus sp. FJAT-27225]
MGIRTTLLELESATKVELSEKLKISFPTISKFLAQMEKEGEIFSIGLDESSGGRRANRYKYNREYMLGLAIFLEKTETNYVIFNCAGEVKKQGQVPSVLVDDGLDALTASIEQLIANHPKISSIAVGVPGSVKNGTVFYIPGYEAYQNFNMKSYYETHFSIPVVVENDMNAAVLGYHQMNKFKNHQSLVYLYSGQNGPGAGFIVNGDVVRGNTFFAGEISFVPLYSDRNFRDATENRDGQKAGPLFPVDQGDAISRLLVSFAAIINPHTVVFSKEDVDEAMIERIARSSAAYIPAEHLPHLTISDWKQDYLYGLQSLGLHLMLETAK